MGDKNNTTKISPPALDLGVERYSAFLSWKEKWTDYVLLSELAAKGKKYQAAMLRYTFSPETRKIYSSLGLTTTQKEDPEEIIKEMEKFAKGIVNETLERHIFNIRNQEEGERFDDYLTELKFLTVNCNFCATCFPGLLRDRIVSGIESDQVRKKLLAEKDLTVDTAVEVCRTHEVASDGMNTLVKKKTEEEVDGVSSSYYNRRGNYSNQNLRSRNYKEVYPRRETGGGEGSISCKFCLRQHAFGRKNCKAWGKKCDDCNLMNHFKGSSTCNKNSYYSNRRPNDESPPKEGIHALFLGAVEESDYKVGRVEESRYDMK